MNLKEGETANEQILPSYSVTKTVPWYAKLGIRWGWIILATVVVVVLLTGILLIMRSRSVASTATYTMATPVAQLAKLPPEGEFWFYTHASQNDAVALSLNHLPPLPVNQQYVAWLSNPLRPNQYIMLSVLKPDGEGKITLQSEQIAGFNANGSNLPEVYIKLLVTREQASVTLDRPSQTTILQGTLSKSPSPQMQSLLFGNDGLPKGVSLAMDLRMRIHKLVLRMQDLENAQNKHDSIGARRQSRRILYLLEGKTGADVTTLKIAGSSIVIAESDGFALSNPGCQPGQADCGYLERLRANIQGLTTTQEITSQQQQQLLAMLATLTAQVQQARQQVLPLATTVTLSPSDIAQISKLQQTLKGLESGVDANQNGIIDRVPGEAGALQFEQALQQVGAVKLIASGK
jgi:hypothetical protein